MERRAKDAWRVLRLCGGGEVHLAQLLILGIVAARVTGHALLCHWVLVRLLLLLEIALVVQGGFGGHVGGRHRVVVWGHATLLGRDLGVLVVIWRLDLVVDVAAIRVPARGLRGVQAGLVQRQ